LSLSIMDCDDPTSDIMALESVIISRTHHQNEYKMFCVFAGRLAPIYRFISPGQSKKGCGFQVSVITIT
jgi:hypothetical protein